MQKSTRIFLGWIFLMFSPCLIQAQKGTDQIVGFGCGYGGQWTESAQKFVDLRREANWKKLNHYLMKGKAAEQFLAAVILLEANCADIRPLSHEEAQQIEALRSDERKVGVCSGCTYWESVPLSQLLSEEAPHFIRQTAELHLKHLPSSSTTEK